MSASRSLLCVPANRENMVVRAHQAPADVIVLDLEDSVPASEKVATRAGLQASVASLKAAGKTVHIRVNHLETGLTLDDLAAAVATELDGLAYPKTEDARQVHELDALIRLEEQRNGRELGSIGLTPHVESALGILNCREISTAAGRITGIGLSAFDYVADLGVERTSGGVELDYARRVIVHCCAARKIIALDAPYGDFRDEAGLITETEYVKSIGFKGKYLIHPAQIELVNRVFAPDPKAIEEARRIVSTFDEAMARGEASVQIDGRMIDLAVVRRARDLIAYADSIA